MFAPYHWFVHLSVEWEKKIDSSPEVKQAKLNPEWGKMRQLQEELIIAEVWER